MRKFVERVQNFLEALDQWTIVPWTSDAIDMFEQALKGKIGDAAGSVFIQKTEGKKQKPNRCCKKPKDTSSSVLICYTHTHTHTHT